MDKKDIFKTRSLLILLLMLAAVCSQSYAYRTAYAPRPGRLVVVGKDTGGTPPAGDDFVAIACGANHNIAMRADGTCEVWTENNNEFMTDFYPLHENEKFIRIACGRSHWVVQRPDGTLLAGGWYESGGRANILNVLPGNDWIDIHGGGGYTCAIKGDGDVPGQGTLWFWSFDGTRGTVADQYGAQYAGNNFLCTSSGNKQEGASIRPDGTIVAWGWDTHGQNNVGTDPGWLDISRGGYKTLALTPNHEIKVWGAQSADWRPPNDPNNNFIFIGGGKHGSAFLTENGYTIYQDYEDVDFEWVTFDNVLAVASGWHHVVAIIAVDGKPVRHALGSCRQPNLLKVTVSMSPEFGIVPMQVDFSASVEGGAGPYSFKWIFGDGATSSESNPSHTYAAAGVYYPMVTVYDAGGKQGSAMCPTVIASGGPLNANISQPQPPVNIMAGEGLDFTGSVSGGVPPYKYAWSFPGATETSGSGPGPLSREYDGIGAFTATVTVSDSSPSPQSAAAEINITVSPSPLTVDFVDFAVFAKGWLDNNIEPGGGLVGWYKFDETSGEVAVDTSGKGHHGTLMVESTAAVADGFVWQPAGGRLGGALLFDGDGTGPVTENPSPRVEIPTAGMSVAAGTVSLWMNLTDPAPVNDDSRSTTYYLFGLKGPGQYDRIKLYIFSTTPLFRMYLGTYSYVQNAYYTFNRSGWYNVALTWDNGIYQIYINGGPIAPPTGDGTYDSFAVLPATADIGNKGESTWNQSFHGLVDDVRIYDYALDTGEIAQTAAGASPYDFGYCIGIPAMDFNGDCVVGYEDLNMFVDNWLMLRRGW